MYIGTYIDLVHRAEKDLVDAFKKIADAHGDEVDVFQTCLLLSSWSQALADDTERFVEKYKSKKQKEPDRLSRVLLDKPRDGNLALLRDLQDMYLMVSEVEVCCVVLKQGASGLRDEALLQTCEEVHRQTKRQLSWLLSRMKSAAPQILIAAESTE